MVPARFRSHVVHVIESDHPRNLFGFKDGTANIVAEDDAALAEMVWVDPADDPGASWLGGGTYLVARRIDMHIETWDRTSLGEQEAVIGRDKRHGAPLSGGTEFSEPEFALTGNDGPLIPVDSHVRLAHPSENGGTRLLRRGYNFTDGSDGLGRLDAGLFFIAFTRDPVRHFVPMQTKLARDDRLSEYPRHTGSALFAVPPGVRGADRYVGDALFES
ncbi:MAG: Dyp-type peroxidase [Ilumatobacteraceae bacterium]